MIKSKSKNNKKNQIGNRKAGSRYAEQQRELTLIKTYPHQIAWEVWLPATPIKYTTVVTTGLIAQVLGIQANSVASFATRFASTFVEYRIVRAIFRIRLFSSTNPGVVQLWIDEKNTGTPTLAEAQERAVLVLSASATDTQPVLNWACSDTLDLQYINIATVSTTLATFKVYTNNTNFGSSIVATDYLEVEPVFQFQFRGLQGV